MFVYFEEAEDELGEVDVDDGDDDKDDDVDVDEDFPHDRHK